MRDVAAQVACAVQVCVRTRCRAEQFCYGGDGGGLSDIYTVGDGDAKCGRGGGRGCKRGEDYQIQVVLTMLPARPASGKEDTLGECARLQLPNCPTRLHAPSRASKLALSLMHTHPKSYWIRASQHAAMRYSLVAYSTAARTNMDRPMSGRCNSRSWHEQWYYFFVYGKQVDFRTEFGAQRNTIAIFGLCPHLLDVSHVGRPVVHANEECTVYRRCSRSDLGSGDNKDMMQSALYAETTTRLIIACSLLSKHRDQHDLE
eukprot:IDg7416t1